MYKKSWVSVSPRVRIGERMRGRVCAKAAKAAKAVKAVKAAKAAEAATTASYHVRRDTLPSAIARFHTHINNNMTINKERISNTTK
jgi:hypothetical protein